MKIRRLLLILGVIFLLSGVHFLKVTFNWPAFVGGLFICWPTQLLGASDRGSEDPLSLSLAGRSAHLYTLFDDTGGDLSELCISLESLQLGVSTAKPKFQQMLTSPILPVYG